MSTRIVNLIDSLTEEIIHKHSSKRLDLENYEARRAFSAPIPRCQSKSQHQIASFEPYAEPYDTHIDHSRRRRHDLQFYKK